MILASIANHYFLSNLILPSFPQIISSALFIKEKSPQNITSTTYCSATTADIGKAEQGSLFPLVDKYLPVPQNTIVYVSSYTACTNQFFFYAYLDISTEETSLLHTELRGMLKGPVILGNLMQLKRALEGQEGKDLIAFRGMTYWPDASVKYSWKKKKISITLQEM